MATKGEVIQRLREQRGWTLRELAEKTGIPFQRIAMRESGGTRIKADELEVFAKAFGMTVESIERMWQTSSLPLRAAEDRGIPIINKAPAGKAWDYEAYGVSSREGRAYMARLPGEESDDLFAVEVIGDSMEPELHPGDLVVLWPVVQGVPPESIDGRIVLVTFSEESDGGLCLAKMKLNGKSDPELGLGAQLVKVNPKHKSRDIWLTDLVRLASATRVDRRL